MNSLPPSNSRTKAVFVGVLFIVAVLLCLYWSRIIVAAPPHVTIDFGDGPVEYAPTTKPTPPTPIPPIIVDPPRSLFGVNLDALRDYSTQRIYIDVMKTARPFGSYQNPADQAAPKNKLGWPTTQQSGTVVWTENVNPAGTYKLIYSGATSAKLLNSGGSKFQNVVATTQRTTADVVVPEGTTQLWLQFSGEEPVTNVQLIRPGYTDATQVFTTEFTTELKDLGIGAIRFMDFLGTNNNTVVSWSERTTKDSATYATLTGGPLEDTIALCNLLHVDLYFNVPPRADDDYIRRGLALIDGTLDRNLCCYLEYANEVWNTASAFYQTNQYNFNQAKAEVAAGDTTLSIGGTDTNVYYWAWRRVAKQYPRFKALGAGAPRFRSVLASQVGYGPKMIQVQCEYLDKYFGGTSSVVYAISGAPYFGATAAAKADPNLTPTAYAQAVYQNATAIMSANSQFYLTYAKQKNVKYLAYETGLHDDSAVNTQAVLDGQDLPLTGDGITRALNTWFDAGGGPLFYFVSTSRYFAKPGPTTQPKVVNVWGLNSVTGQRSVKFLGAQKVATTRKAV